MLVVSVAMAWLTFAAAPPDVAGPDAHRPVVCRNLEKCLAAVETTAAGGHGVSEPETLLAEAIQAYGVRAVPGLIALLQRPRPVRTLAAYVLRDLDGLTEAEVPALAAALKAGETWLAPALGRIGSPAALEALYADLQAAPEAHTQVTYAFEKAGARGVPMLLRAFDCREPCADDLLAAVTFIFHELGAQGVSGVERLTAIALDRRRPVAARQSAVLSLGAVGEDAIVAASALQKLARSEPGPFGETVQEALVGMKAPAAVDALVAKLGREPEMAAFLSLAKMRGAGRGAGPTLVRLLGHGNWGVRTAAARTLGYVGYAEASAPLVALLGNQEDWQLVYVAAESLGRLKEPKAIAPLEIVAANHWYPPVRDAGRKAGDVIRGRATYQARWHEDNFGFEFSEYEHVGNDLPECAMATNAAAGPLTASDDLGRALALGLTYDAKIVAYGPGPGGRAIRHENPIKQKPSAALELPDGWLLGGNRGEWGGELVFVDRRGSQALVLDDNVHAIVRLGARVIALAGLSHLYSNHGLALEVARGLKGGWTARPWRTLPGSPRGVFLLPDGRLRVDTSGGAVVMSPDGKVAMAACPPSK